MARVRFFNGAATSAVLNFGELSAASITSFTSTRIVLTGADGQQFVAHGSGFAVDLVAGTVAGVITRLDWRDPDGGLLSITDGLNYPAQRAFDALLGDPADPDDPDGAEGLVVDGLSGDDVIIGAPDGIGGYYADQGYSFNRIYVGTGDDTVTGGPGNERVQVGDGGTLDFDGGGGIDDVDYLFGSFEGTRGIDLDLVTGVGLNPFGGTDRIVRVENVFGTIFDDAIRGNGQANALNSGAAGRDRLSGRGGDDQLVVNFDLPVAGLDDVLNGGDGNDLLQPGTGADRILGGAGRDTVLYLPEFDDPTTIVVDLVDPANNRGSVADDVISEVEVFEVVWGPTSATTVRFVGNAADNTFIARNNSTTILEGNGGDDTLEDRGALESDTLRGGDGNDVLFGSGGADVIDGGAGYDIAAFHDVTELDLLVPGASSGEAVGDVFTGIEAFSGLTRFLGSNAANIAFASRQFAFLSGRGGNDLLTGNFVTDTVAGGGGNDRLDGGDGGDILNGGEGNDRLFGGLVNTSLLATDSLNGGTGNDILTGGRGPDRLTGGGGSDTFVFASLGDTGAIGDRRAVARDHVTDFVLGSDTLTFARAGLAGLAAAFGFVEGPAPLPTSATGTFLFDTDNGQLSFDADGNGAAARVLMIVLDGISHLTRGAFETF